METPLKIAFHNMEASDAVEAAIRERFAKLERLYDRMTACRVSVEHDHSQHRTGTIYAVHIDMLVPGHELVVSREPKEAEQKYAHPDVYTSIRDAFAAAERQLKSFKARQRGDVKIHDAPVQGQITQLADDHGFLVTNTGGLLYFHAHSVMNNGFPALLTGDKVQYTEEMGDTGPTASKVWKDMEREIG
ncbi:MAG: hypothetical protein RLY86_1683 [Pseudomonadota bacterium]